jgi:hypothetical protein
MTTVYLSSFNNSYFMIAGISPAKFVYLPLVNTCLTKVITIKESTANTTNKITVATSGFDTIDGPTNFAVSLSTCHSITLQSYTSTLWSILNIYSNPPYQTRITGTPTVVNASGSNSLALVDVRTQSKLVQLPNTFSTIGTTLFLTVKDQYGSASTNALYLSTPSSMFFEGSSMYSTLKLTSSFASIDLLASSNIYSILNLYP